jgi:ABC-type antimicrobial peptide transport system permease subunit
MSPVIARALADIDPNLTILGIRPLDEYVDVQLNSPRLLARLTTLYGALALVLACVGLYGVTSYTVTRRPRELGVRLALGATRLNLMGSVFRQALTPIVAGILISVPAVVFGGRLIASQLFGVDAGNSTVVILAVAMLTGCALLAAIVPARRAGAVEPLEALRAD